LPGAAGPARPWMPAVFTALLGASLLGYVALLVVRLPDILTALSGEGVDINTPEVQGRISWGKGVLTFAAGCALLAVCLPFFVNLLDLRGRRIWAIAKL